MSGTSTPMLSVSQFTTWHQTFEEDVVLYAHLGIEGIEICERKMSTDPGEAREQLAMVKDHGLTVTSVQPRVHALFKDFMCPDLIDPVERMARFRRSIDLFGESFPGEQITLVTIGGNAPDLNFQYAHRVARELYPQVADYAADRGIRMSYEPLSPVLMNNDTFTCTMYESMDLVEDVGRDNFGFTLDTYHVWREPGIYERIRAAGDRIFVVHISDWPEGEPRHPGDRRICGEGIMDLPRIFGAIEDAGFSGAYALEIFSIDELPADPASLWLADPAHVINASREGFKRAWEKCICD